MLNWKASQQGSQYRGVTKVRDLGVGDNKSTPGGVTKSRGLCMSADKSTPRGCDKFVGLLSGTDQISGYFARK